MAKQARALLTYDRVLDAAAYEFAQYGYANANLQNIADRVGLTKGALYGHFSNKEELAAALADHLSAIARPLLTDAGTPGIPALDRLQSLVLALGWLFQTDPRSRAALRLAIETARAQTTPVPVLEETKGVTLCLVTAVQQEGDWDASVSPELLAELIVYVAFGAFLVGPDIDRKGSTGTVAAMWDLLTRMLDRTHRP